MKKLNNTEQILIRLSEFNKHELKLFCVKNRITISQLIRNYIKKCIED